MLVRLGTFTGEVPRLPAHLLPETGAQYALNCDFAHGELRGLRGLTDPPLAFMQGVGGAPMVAVWTEDGARFFAWPWEVDVVKSQVVGDVHYRIFYSGLPGDGPVLKVARTYRNNAGALTPVIGNDSLLGNGFGGSGNFKPPEVTNVGFGGNGLGPDSWLLGIPEPKAQNVATTDALVAALQDRRDWPAMPRLRLRVTLFYEDPAGQIVFQKDVSNNEAGFVPANPANVFPNVFYTNAADASRGNKIQDMMFPLTDYGTKPTPAPYKYYWCDPPASETIAIARSVTITNTAAPGSNQFIFIDYDGPISGTPGSPDGGGGATDGNEA